MRIITGKYKNRKIITETKYIKLEAKKIRPTTEKLRGAAFNMLSNFFDNEHKCILKNKKVLDLCCGIGSFGLEALSREALLVTFVDNNRSYLEIVKLNLERLNCSNNAKLIFSNAQNLTSCSEHYDLIYIDPPYRLKILRKIIESLLQNNWIQSDTVIIVESSIKENKKISDNLLQLIAQRQYGNSSLSFYRKNNVL